MMSYRPGWFSPHVKVLPLETVSPTSDQVSVVAPVLVLVNVTGAVIVVMIESSPGVKLAVTPQLFRGCAGVCERVKGGADFSKRLLGAGSLIWRRSCFCHCIACHSS